MCDGSPRVESAYEGRVTEGRVNIRERSHQGDIHLMRVGSLRGRVSIQEGGGGAPRENPVYEGGSLGDKLVYERGVTRGRVSI